MKVDAEKVVDAFIRKIKFQSNHQQVADIKKRIDKLRSILEKHKTNTTFSGGVKEFVKGQIELLIKYGKTITEPTAHNILWGTDEYKSIKPKRYRGKNTGRVCELAQISHFKVLVYFKGECQEVPKKYFFENFEEIKVE